VYGTRYATDRQVECRLHDLEVALKIELRRQKRKAATNRATQSLKKAQISRINGVVKKKAPKKRAGSR
jgi:hypothetical protein